MGTARWSIDLGMGIGRIIPFRDWDICRDIE
jgi:hypothetical protein